MCERDRMEKSECGKMSQVCIKKYPLRFEEGDFEPETDDENPIDEDGKQGDDDFPFDEGGKQTDDQKPIDADGKKDNDQSIPDGGDSKAKPSGDSKNKDNNQQPDNKDSNEQDQTTPELKKPENDYDIASNNDFFPPTRSRSNGIIIKPTKTRTRSNDITPGALDFLNSLSQEKR